MSQYQLKENFEIVGSLGSSHTVRNMNVFIVIEYYPA